MSRVKETDLQEVMRLRGVSQRLTQHIRQRLTSYLSTLTPLFAPRRVLGEYMQSAFTDRVPGAEKHFEEMKEEFKALARNPFGITSSLASPVSNIPNQPVAQPWEYLHRLEGDADRLVTISSPVRWVLSYSGGATLSELHELHLAGERPEPDDARQLIIRNLTMGKLLDASPGLKQVLADLRFGVSIERAEVAGDLGFVVLSSDVPAFRPQEEIIQQVIELSGKPVFEELIDVDSLGEMDDPFRSGLLALVD